VVCTPTRTNDVARTSTPHLPLPDKRPVSVAVYQFPEISKFQNELRSEFQNEIRNLREEKDRGKDREKDEAQASLEATIELPRRSPEETSRMEAELKSVREELAQAITIREEKDRLLQRKDTELKFLTTAKERLEADVLAKAAREAVNAKEPNKHEGQIEMLKHQRKSLDAKVDRLVAELEREKVRSGELERLVERKEEEVHALRAEVKSRAVDDRRCTELREELTLVQREKQILEGRDEILVQKLEQLTAEDKRLRTQNAQLSKDKHELDRKLQEQARELSLLEGQMRQERSASVHSPAVFLQMVRSHEPKAWPQYKADLELEVYKLQSDADTMCQTLDNLSRGQR